MTTHGVVRATLTGEPTLSGGVTALSRQQTLTAQPQLRRHSSGGSPLSRILVGGKLATGVTRLQARIIVSGGHEGAGGDVPGTHSVAPRHPFGGQQGVVARNENDLIDGDVASAQGTRHRDGPPPSSVSRMRAFEEMGQNALVLDDRPDVLTDPEVTRATLGRFPSLVNSLRDRRVNLDGPGRSARSRRHLCHHSSNSSATARSILATAPAVRGSG